MNNWLWICIEGYICWVGGFLAAGWIINRIVDAYENRKKGGKKK